MLTLDHPTGQRPPLNPILLLHKRLSIPDALCILINTPIAAKKAHPPNRSNSLGRPLLRVLVALVNELLRLDVGREVVGDEVVVAVLDDAVEQRGEGARVAKLARVDGVEDVGEVGVELVLLVEVAVAEVFDVLGQVAEEEDVFFANLARDFDLVWLVSCAGLQVGAELTLAPSQVPMMRPPFKQNFMLLVPEASVPAVEMCSEMSLAGQIISALLTL